MTGVYEGPHITFCYKGVPPNRKTSVWEIHNRYEYGLLGTVKWFGRWRKYCFFPAADCVFEEVCMREISQFIVDRTNEHRHDTSGV